jgi:hypothetical protein
MRCDTGCEGLTTYTPWSLSVQQQWTAVDGIRGLSPLQRCMCLQWREWQVLEAALLLHVGS